MRELTCSDDKALFSITPVIEERPATVVSRKVADIMTSGKPSPDKSCSLRRPGMPGADSVRPWNSDVALPGSSF